ncbi:holin [Streptococcus phage A25]|uniref:Class I holin n=5 Tax=root TaxID=1 RepID=A0A0M4R3G6_9CAUD|nr:phage holin family protein [Streptococcus dysgalactiae]YP_009191551.1 holin [Streptococcus phage A25]ALF02724.1 class I holin [Streptococcus phage A25]MDQ0263181.1 toxin secretion/phage lysis holin [Streptococcus dysgalactiae]GFK30744.1 hypothetical protein ScFU149_08610 [Streptococcus canis]
MSMIIDLSNLAHLFSDLTKTLEIHIFTIFVCFDIFTGLVKGITNKKANSTKGLSGIIKHFLVVLLVYTVYPYLILLGAKAVAVAFVLFFIAAYGISIIENWGQLGLPMPSFVKMFFEKLKRDTDQFDIATIKIDKTGVKVQTPASNLEQLKKENNNE